VSDPSLIRFRAVVQAALGALEARREEVNELNVFPVADGDTGDNMVLTLRAVLQELDRLSQAAETRSLDEINRDEIVNSVARAALLGARGNSGVILSQLIRGAAEELASRPGELVDPVLIGAALARAADHVEPVVVDLTGVSGVSGAGIRALREHEENFVAVLVNLHSEVGQALTENGMSRLVYRPRRRPGRLAATAAAPRARARRRWPHATEATRSRNS